MLQVPALQLDQLAKQAEPAPPKPPVEVAVEAQPVAQPAEASQPVPKPNVPQLIFLPEKVSTWLLAVWLLLEKLPDLGTVPFSHHCQEAGTTRLGPALISLL